jgi:hypothetical protein
MAGDRQSEPLQGAGTRTTAPRTGYGHRASDVAALTDLVPAALAADRPTVVHLDVA